jgi:hypothetical protein
VFNVDDGASVVVFNTESAVVEPITRLLENDASVDVDVSIDVEKSVDVGKSMDVDVSVEVGKSVDVEKSVDVDVSIDVVEFGEPMTPLS